MSLADPVDALKYSTDEDLPTAHITHTSVGCLLRLTGEDSLAN